MASSIVRWRLSTLLCAIFALVHSVSALSNAYCSPQNTGGNLYNQSIYMSMGSCHDSCVSSYAFAVLQDSNCWCSNFIPANQVTATDCNEQCPGYPDDMCGSLAKGLYGYIKLDLAASGTASASSSSVSQTSTSSAGPISSSLYSSSSQEPLSSTDSTASENVFPTSSFPSSQSQESETSSATATTPITSVQVVTLSGSPVTQTVTSTPTTASTSLLGGHQEKSSSMSGGLIAAAVIASVFGVVIIAAIVFFFWRRRRQNHDNEKFGDINDDPSSPANLNRNASTNSKAGLLDRSYAPTITTRVSSHGGLDMSSSSDAVSPVTPNSDHRHSRPIMYDQRLNPNALMVIDNGSHTSLNTLDDHRDYGRMLKVVNPDDTPRPSIS